MADPTTSELPNAALAEDRWPRAGTLGIRTMTPDALADTPAA